MSRSELQAMLEQYSKKIPENRPSYFQMKYFVLGSEPTTQAKLWQCLREIKSKKDSIENLEVEIANQQDQKTLIEIEVEQEEIMECQINDENKSISKNALRNRKMELYQKQKTLNLNILKRKAESVVKNINRLEKQLEFLTQEATFYVRAFEELSKIEKVKDFDDLEAQKEYWDTKITEEINLRLLGQQNIGVDLLKTALSLHDGSKVKAEVVELIEKAQEFNVKKAIQQR